MNYRNHCLLAVLLICVSASVATAKAAHPLAGTYLSANTVYGYEVLLKISARGSVSGSWGVDYDGGNYSLSGRITEDGFLSMILKTNGKRFTERIKAIGELWLNESGGLTGYIQLEGREPQDVEFIRQ